MSKHLAYSNARRVLVRFQLPTSAENVTLLAFAAERRPCSDQPISTAGRAHSSKPAAPHAAVAVDRRHRRTDTWTDTVSLPRTSPHVLCPLSSNGRCCLAEVSKRICIAHSKHESQCAAISRPRINVFQMLPKLSVAGYLVNCSTRAVLRQQNLCRREWYACVEQRVSARKMSGDDDDHARRRVECRQIGTDVVLLTQDLSDIEARGAGNCLLVV